MELLLSLLTALLASVFAIEVGRHYLARRRAHLLVWSGALACFAVGAGCQFVGDLVGWSPSIYRLWYLTGAVMAAAYLGQGTVYLLVRRRIAHALSVVLALGSLYALLAVVTAPVDLTQAVTAEGVTGTGMPRSVRMLTPFFNIYGTLALVVGALTSVWRFLWRGGSGNRALGTSLIGVGALIVASGGTLTRLGSVGWLYAAELAGILAIYAGFRLSSHASVDARVETWLHAALARWKGKDHGRDRVLRT